MNRNISFTILIALFLASCTKAEIPPTPTSTSILIPSPTPTEIPATPTEAVEPFLKEPLAQELSHTGEAYDVPQTFVVRVTKSMVPGPNARKGATKEKGLFNGVLGYSIWDKEDFFGTPTPDDNATGAKERMIKSIAWKKYMWWKINATEEQRQAVKAAIGKDIENIAVEEYWNMVKEGNNADLVAVPIYGYNPETDKVEWNMVDPNAATAVRFTDVDNTKLMTVYKNGNDTYANDAHGTIVQDGEVELLIKMGELYEIYMDSIDIRIIYALNRIAMPLANQLPGESGVLNYDLDNAKNIDSILWNMYVFSVPGRGDISPFVLNK